MKSDHFLFKSNPFFLSFAKEHSPEDTWQIDELKFAFICYDWLFLYLER